MTQPAAASRGRIVVVAGPDGSEKSSLCDVLIHDVLIDRGSVLLLHHHRVSCRSSAA
jgi:alpha-D-ribose 1-methylphosphonate 5-triphosphate synthase subunit PhnL